MNIYEKIEKYGYLVIQILVVSLVVFVPLRELFGHFISPSTKLTIDLLVGLLLLTMLLINKFKVKFNIIDIIFALYILVILVSFLINGTDLYFAILQLRGAAIFYIVYFALRNIHTTRAWLVNLLTYISKPLIYIIIISVLVAFVEVASKKELFFPLEWANSIRLHNLNRAYGIINNPNLFGAFLLLGAILIKYCNDNIGKPTSKILYIITGVGVMLTQSRSAVLGGLLIVAILAYPTASSKIIAFVKSRKYSAKYITMSSIIILSGCLVSILLLAQLAPKTEYGTNRFLDMVNGNELRNSGVDGRFYIVKYSMSIYSSNGNYLLGIGPGMLNNQTSTANQYGIPSGYTTDNQHLKILVELGIIGYLIFVALISALIWKYRHNRVALSLIITITFWGLFYNSFEIQVIMLYFWLILALIELTGSPNTDTVDVN